MTKEQIEALRAFYAAIFLVWERLQEDGVLTAGENELLWAAHASLCRVEKIFGLKFGKKPETLVGGPWYDEKGSALIGTKRYEAMK